VIENGGPARWRARWGSARAIPMWMTRSSGTRLRCLVRGSFSRPCPVS